MAWIEGAQVPRRSTKSPRHVRLSIESLESRLAPAADWRSIIGLDALQSAYPYRGDGYTVAILDTGIDYNHPDLGGGFGPGHRVVDGYDFINNDANPIDDNGHGTHLAGIIGSSNPNSPGIAPDVHFVALKVLDANNNGNWTAVDSALQWVINHRAQYNIVAVNLSLGTGDYTSNPYALLESDFSSLKSLGVFTAVAAGNRFFTYNSQPGLSYPAISPNVVSVGATWAGNFGQSTFSNGAIDYTTAVDRVASFGQRSSALSIMAPGAWITSTWLNGGYQEMGGTSMATAVISGSAVLLHQAYDQTGQSAKATQDNILQVMRTTGVNVVDGDDENDNVVDTGLTFKRINLKAAMDTIGQPNGVPVFNAIPNQTMSVFQTITVPMNATDIDNDPISFSVKEIYLPALAYQLDQQYTFNYLGGYYLNSRGANEKWIIGASNVWYAIMPNGEVRRWTGTMADTLTPANLIATLDASYYADPSKLWNAPYAGMPPAVFSISGNKLSIRSPASWLGTYTVQATATDGHFNVVQNFTVTVRQANVAPVLTAVPNQVMSHSQHTLTLTLSATDANNDPLTYSAQVLPTNGVPPAVTVSVVGKQVTINPAISFVGTFSVQVSVSDGQLSDTKTFSVTVTNNAVVLGTIAAQTMAKNQTSLSVALPATDADNDALTFQAAVQTPDAQAYSLNQTYNFLPTNATYYLNLYGYNEKWLTSKNNLWYMLLPDGRTYRWNLSIAQTMTAANFIAQVDPKIYAEPRLLWNAAPPVTPAITFSFSGNQITIQRPATLTGIFYIDVTVSDGATTAKRTFQITLN
jgi:Subtilase family/Bacterial Ig domain